MTYRTIIAALFLTLSLSSCIKDRDYEPVQFAGLSVINAVPSTELLDVYADNNKTTPTDFSFGTKVDYLNAFVGSRNITVTKKNSGTSIYAERFTLENQVGYSLFVIDQLANVKLLLLKDNLTRPATGKAKVRFVHLSPDAPALGLGIQGVATDIFTGKSFKEYTDFQEITPGTQLNFQIKNANGDVVATVADVKVEEGNIYTVYARGLLANTDATKFGAAIFTHK